MNPRRHTSSPRRVTFRDRLSRLSYTQACKLLGSHGGRLIREGGAFDISLVDQVELDGRSLRLHLDGAMATISHSVSSPHQLHWRCTDCPSACVHVGAAFSLILEEKTALGLAIPPIERVPIESLSDEELVARAMSDRAERARKERMTVKPQTPGKLWADYLVTNSQSGKTYRVALRGWDPGDSYCTCPDFRTNTLGICKHIIKVQQRSKRRFSASTQRRPFKPRKVTVHLKYGERVELHVLVPSDLQKSLQRIVKPISGEAIADIHDLLSRINRLESHGHGVMIYPDAEEYINKRLFAHHIASLVSKIRANPAKHPLGKELLDARLLPYQLDGIAFAVGAGRAILADDMGLGKTIQGIGVAELLRREAGIRRVLVVCPATLKSQWRSEIHRFCRHSCQLVLGSAAERAQQYGNDSFFTVCNYEQVLRDIMPIERASWDLIILDEGQRIKNWESKTSRVIKGLRSRFALVLSGTPLENKLDELYSVVEFVDDRRLGPAFRFFNRHRVVDEKGKVLGYKSLAELRELLKPILLRRTRASVMQDLPRRSSEIIRITPTAEQIELHRANLRIVSSIVNKPYISEMDLLRLRKSLLMCRMSADSTFLVDKQPPGYSSKLDALDDLLGALLQEEDRKVVLFSEWTTMLDLIEPLIRKRRASYVRLDGSIPQKKRQALVHEFQSDKDCRLFITTNAGATGLNLQAANTVINVDLPWNPAILEQRIARAHRMGQKNPVQVYVLVTEGTIEENLLGTLSAKQELALAALDVESEVDQLDLTSGVNELKNRLEVLLGARPDAPIGERIRGDEALSAEALARREQVSLAAGEMFSAAFAFIGELFPEQEDGQFTPQLTESRAGAIKQRLKESIVPSDGGGYTLEIALPDEASLDKLAGSVARLLASGDGGFHDRRTGSPRHPAS